MLKIDDFINPIKHFVCTAGSFYERFKKQNKILPFNLAARRHNLTGNEKLQV